MDALVPSLRSVPPATTPGPAQAVPPPPVVRGHALIFSDSRVQGEGGRKLDDVDTDQITPARDCVSHRLAASALARYMASPTEPGLPEVETR